MTDINKVLAARDAILQRNATLRSIAPGGAVDPDKAHAFAVKMKNALAAGASIPPPAVQGPSGTDTSFGAAVKSAVTKINTDMEVEDTVTEAYERGETTDIVAVMLQKQKSDIEFETTLQIRNKLLSAYKDIMNMQI